MSNGDPETKEAGGTQWDAPNQQVVRDDASAPWEEGSGGEGGQPVERSSEENGELPGRHAPLDDLAAERGHEWSREDLTVAEKKAELGG